MDREMRFAGTVQWFLGGRKEMMESQASFLGKVLALDQATQWIRRRAKEQRFFVVPLPIGLQCCEGGQRWNPGSALFLSCPALLLQQVIGGAVVSYSAC